MVSKIKREFLIYGDEENCDRSRFYEGRLGFLYWTIFFDTQTLRKAGTRIISVGFRQAVNFGNRVVIKAVNWMRSPIE